MAKHCKMHIGTLDATTKSLVNVGLLRKEYRTGSTCVYRPTVMARANKSAVDKYPPQYETKSGIKVRSKIEKIIADYLTNVNCTFEYEKELVIDGVSYHPDFYLTQLDLYIEHAGMIKNKDYLKRLKSKQSAYSSAGINVCFTYPEHEFRIESVLGAIIMGNLEKIPPITNPCPNGP
jgi:hypothetical protein